MPWTLSAIIGIYENNGKKGYELKTFDDFFKFKRKNDQLNLSKTEETDKVLRSKCSFENVFTNSGDYAILLKRPISFCGKQNAVQRTAIRKI